MFVYRPDGDDIMKGKAGERYSLISSAFFLVTAAVYAIFRIIKTIVYIMKHCMPYLRYSKQTCTKLVV